MTKQRIKSLQKNLKLISEDLDDKNYLGALKGADSLTICGFGLPLMSPAYRHARHMQHALYYYQAGYHGLGNVRQEIKWIDNYLRRAVPEIPQF